MYVYSILVLLYIIGGPPVVHYHTEYCVYTSSILRTTDYD